MATFTTPGDLPNESDILGNFLLVGGSSIYAEPGFLNPTFNSFPTSGDLPSESDILGDFLLVGGSSIFAEPGALTTIPNTSTGGTRYYWSS